MPELPDVETMRRRLESRGLRRTVADVAVLDGYVLHGLPPATLAGALEGREFVRARRHGKYLFCGVRDAPWLVLHFGMTGDLVITPPAAASGKAAPGDFPQPYARVVFRFADGGAMGFVDVRKLGRIGLVDDPARFVADRRLGPDALDPKLTEGEFAKRLASRGGVLKGLLLDQTFVAGLGNIYADEVCLRARIAPLSRVAGLTAEDRRALYEAIRGVLGEAVTAHADVRRLPEDWLIHQRRADGVCLTCGGAVARERYQGRYTYWCPACQHAR